MALFVVRYYFSRDDYVQQMLEANSLEDAEHSVYQNVHPPHMVTAGEFPVFSFDNEGRIFLVARDHVRYCEILPAPEGEGAMRHADAAEAAAGGENVQKAPIGS